MSSTEGVTNNVDFSRISQAQQARKHKENTQRADKNHTDNSQDNPVKVNLSEKTREALKSAQSQHHVETNEDQIDREKVKRLQQKLEAWQGLKEEHLDKVANGIIDNESAG